MKPEIVILTVVSALLMLGAVSGQNGSVTADSSGEVDIGVGIGRTCLVGAKNFEAPGTGVRDYMFFPLNSTGTITGVLGNYGNQKAELVMNLTVTNESDHWEPGEPPGDPVNLEQHNYTNYDYEVDRANLSSQNTGNATSENDTFIRYVQRFTSFISYGTGNYTARLNVSYSCGNVSDSFWVNRTFRIFKARAGEGGGSQIGKPQTNNTKPQDANQSGEESNQNITRNATKPGGKSNQTRPEDVNQTGETSDQTIQGNNPLPGQTPVPQPQPQPQPDPVVRVDLRALNNTYKAPKESYKRVKMEIENIGDTATGQLDIIPQVPNDNWDVRNASVANLSINTTKTRNVFIRPGPEVEKGLYQIPTVVRNQEGEMIDLDYFDVRVTGPKDEKTQLTITESPLQVSVTQNSSQKIPILLSNSGTTDLENITARLQNAEECGITESPEIQRLGANETSSVTISLNSSTVKRNCEATLIVSSSQGAYAFSDIKIDVNEPEGIIPERFRFPLIGSLWTIMLLAYALLSRRYGLDSVTVKAPFVVLVVGEVGIAIYLATKYYGLLPDGVLPF
ncbi:MAG: hypothetical protein ABEK16_02860 [Candidatus Nanohalobium sp.]